MLTGSTSRTRTRFTSRTVFVLAVLGVACGKRSTHGAADEHVLASLTDAGATAYGLGRPVMPEEVRALGSVIFPDGTGLPAGSGTALQGEVVFATRCAGCHGPSGVGATGPRLVRARSVALGYRIGRPAPGEPPATFADFYPYATTLFEYTRRAMPWNEPGSLGDDDVYALVAYMLWLNGLVARDAALDARSLPAVAMPARTRFREEDPPQL